MVGRAIRTISVKIVVCVDVDVLHSLARQCGFDGAQHRPSCAVVTADDAEPQVELGGEIDQTFDIFVTAHRRSVIRQDADDRDGFRARSSEDVREAYGRRVSQADKIGVGQP